MNKLIFLEKTKRRYNQYRFTGKKHNIVIMFIYFVFTICEYILNVVGTIVESFLKYLRIEAERNREREYRDRNRREHLRSIYEENAAANAGAAHGAYMGRTRAQERIRDERERRARFNKL